MNHGAHKQVVLIRAGERRLALALDLVVHVLPAVAVTPLSGSAPPVLGTIDVHGDVVPVVDLRLHLGLPPTPPALSDALVMVDTAAGPVALRVDAVTGLAEAHPVSAPAAESTLDDADAFLAAPLAQLRRLSRGEGQP